MGQCGKGALVTHGIEMEGCLKARGGRAGGTAHEHRVARKLYLTDALLVVKQPTSAAAELEQVVDGRIAGGAGVGTSRMNEGGDGL